MPAGKRVRAARCGLCTHPFPQYPAVPSTRRGAVSTPEERVRAENEGPDWIDLDPDAML